MYDSKKKIFSAVVFIILFMGILFLLQFNPIKKTGGKLKVVEITGNKLLSTEEYQKFVQSTIVDSFSLNLSILKDRILKHPYVENADVKFFESGKAQVNLREKKINAILLYKSEPYFITDEYEILPLLNNSRFSSVPIISNLKDELSFEENKKFNSNDLADAFRIIDALRYTNRKILLSLSEINLRNGGDIILTFAGIKPPVVFGRGATARKIIYLDTLWGNLLNGETIVKNSNYIDLRFANEIYSGNTEKIGKHK